MTVTPVFENILPAILRQLDTARNSIRICVPWFTDLQLFNKLIEKGKANVHVEIFILDDLLNKAKFPVNKGIKEFEWYKLDLNKLQEHAHVQLVDKELDFFLHSKFCVIDNKVTITGSYNWSFAARKHIENILIIEDETVARQYATEFSRIKGLKYDRLMARDLPACTICGQPAVRTRLYDYFENDDIGTEVFKEFHFCLAEPVAHITMLHDTEQAGLEFGQLLEEAYQQVNDSADANNIDLSHKSTDDQVAEIITRYFNTSLNLYSEPIGDRLALLAKRTADPMEYGELPMIKLIWNHPLAEPFAENLRDFAEEIMSKFYGLG